MSTDISGDLTSEELDVHIKKLKEIFNGKAKGYFNGKPASYELEVLNYCGFILLQKRFNDDILNFLPNPSIREQRMWDNFSFYLAFIFPCHNLALILSDCILRDIKGIKKLEDLGYATVSKRENAYSTFWSIENKKEVLSALRNPEIQVASLDNRVNQIFEILSDRFEGKIEEYNLGVFRPKRMKSERETEYEFEKDVIKIFHPIKEMLTFPKEWVRIGLERYSKSLPITRAIGLTSRIKIMNTDMHIPMIDFSCSSLGETIKVLEAFGIDGMIINSGKSYHFYGFEPLEEQKWGEFMDGLKKFSAVDKYWPDLQLKQEFSMLRLTPCVEKLYQPCLCDIYQNKKDGPNLEKLYKKSAA